MSTQETITEIVSVQNLNLTLAWLTSTDATKGAAQALMASPEGKALDYAVYDTVEDTVTVFDSGNIDILERWLEDVSVGWMICKHASVLDMNPNVENWDELYMVVDYDLGGLDEINDKLAAYLDNYPQIPFDDAYEAAQKINIYGRGRTQEAAERAACQAVELDPDTMEGAEFIRHQCASTDTGEGWVTYDMDF